MKYKAAMISSKGGRKKNEDYAGHIQRGGYGCYVLADGLGGHYGGDLASKTACKNILASFKKRPGSSVECLNNYLQSASRAMEDLKKRVGQHDGLKTTLVVLLTGSNRATWAHVGDSRLYHFKSGQIAFQTRDHSLPQRLVDIGEITVDQVRHHDDRNRLLRVFDGKDSSRFTFLNKMVPVERHDAFLLCSDGFWEYIYETEMEEDLKGCPSPAAWISRMEKRVLGRAEAKHDNYTALAVMAR